MSFMFKMQRRRFLRYLILSYNISNIKQYNKITNKLQYNVALYKNILHTHTPLAKCSTKHIYIYIYIYIHLASGFLSIKYDNKKDISLWPASAKLT